MNEASIISQDSPSSDGSTDNESSPAAARAQDNHNPNPESQESDLLSGAKREQPPKTSSIGEVAGLGRASPQGSIVLSSTDDSHSAIFSNHPQANDEDMSDNENCAHSQVLTNGNTANESTGIDISEDQITNADPSKSQGNSHGCQAKPSPRWTPLALRLPVLLGFSGLLLAIIAGLEVLSYVSNHNQGLATVVETRYYLWKFGPTFAFTMLATFCTNVEYRTKQIMPWMVMAKNRSGSYGSEGFTLNYLTLSTPGALYKSLKSRHFPVAMGVFGTLILKLVVILSTGLLIAKDQVMTTQTDILALDKLDLSKDSSAAVKQFSSLRSLLAIHAHGLPYPSGTNLDFTSQSLLPLRQAKPGDVSTEAEVFEASLKDCMVFNQTYDYYDYWAADFSRTLFPANIANRLSSFCSNGIPAADLIASEPWEENLHVLTPCSNMSSGDDSHWVFIAIPFAVPEIGFQWSGVACQPTYSLSRRRVAGAASLSSVFQLRSVSENASETLLLGLSPVKLTKMFVAELDVLDVAIYMVNYLDSTTPNSSFNLMFSRSLLYCLNITSPKPRPLDFANTKTLQNSFERFFRSTMALYVRSHYSVPLNLTTNGSFTSAVTRLYVGELSLRFIESFLGLLFIFSMLLLFYKCPLFLQDPAPLAVKTIFLTKNFYLETVLKRIGKVSNQSPAWLFQRDSFYYSVDDGVRTVQLSRNSTLSASTHESSRINTNFSNVTKEHYDRPHGWRQITASWVYRAAVLACTVLLITFLEVSFRISTKNKGLSDISDPSLENYAWTYLPSLVMACISFAYSCLDCTARILHPFQKLYNGNITFKELFWEPMGAFTIQAIIQSAMWHHIALTMILFTSILSPVLTIITSGLFTTRTIQYHGQASYSVLDWFSIEKLHDTADAYSAGEGEHVSNAIEFGNLTFPQWTHEDLLFPQIRLDIDQVEGVQGLAHSMTARLPSIRPQMNCTVRGIWDQAPYNDSAFNVTSLPECFDKGPTMSLSPSVWIVSPPYASYFASLVFTTENALRPGSTAGCLDARTDKWFAVARVGRDVLQDVSLIQCTPYIETLHTVVNFTLPNYTIDLSQARPQPDEPDSVIRVFTLTMEFDRPSSSFNESIDIFFNSVFYGKDGIPPEELLGRANADRLIGQMQRVYGQIMVQMMNEYRVPITPNISAAFPGLLDPSTFNATVFTHKQRLVQSALATRMLEGVLAAMALCAAIHYALTPKTRLLPYDPGSIAAKMKLFAGSRLVRMIRERDGELDDELLGEVLSLGWWDEEEDETARSETGERKRWFGIDVGVAGKEE